MSTNDVNIVEGITAENVDDALHVAYEAFSDKFRIGYRDADDHVMLFHDSVDKTSCLTAIVDGRLAGILTFQTSNQEFYRLNLGTVFRKLNPLRATRVLINLLLLAEGCSGDEFRVDSLAVDPANRGLGIGTKLMHRAEAKAKSMGKRVLTLSVIGDNHGAIRLYERLGLEITRTHQGFMVRMVTGSNVVHHMEKTI